MSLPTFPEKPQLSLCDSLNMILASVAMEEIALSHIINAEGEKLQHILREESCASQKEILEINKSVKALLDSVMQNQVILKSKMECALDALDLKGCKSGCGCSDSCQSAEILKNTGQCWHQGCMLALASSETVSCMEPDGCRREDERYCECDCACNSCAHGQAGKIPLPCGKDYILSFCADLCVKRRNSRSAVIAVRIFCGGTAHDEFVIRTPIIYEDTPFMVSASGIHIPQQDANATLSLVLLAPSAVEVCSATLIMQPL